MNESVLGPGLCFCVNESVQRSIANGKVRPAREIVKQEMADLSCRKPIEELDTLVDCSKVVAELGWDQPQSLDESLVRYQGRESIKPYD